MTKRIFKAIALVGFIVLLACLLCIMGVLYDYFGSRLDEELRSEAQYIALGVENDGMAYLEALRGGDTRITWIAADGSVMYDSDKDAEKMENHGGREEVEEALESGSGEAVRYSSTMSEKTLYFAVRLSDGSILRVSGTQYTVWMLVVSMLQPIITVAVIGIIIALILASRLSKQIVRPINAINLENPGDSEAYDEIAPLLGRIRAQNRTIERQISELERKQKEFSAITENMEEGFIVVDSRENVLSYNSSALRLFKAEAPEKGKSVSVLTFNRSESFTNTVEAALGGKRSELSVRQGESCYSIVANPAYEDGAVIGAIVIILDVTEREKREELRREFSANVSHELKTPLTSILGTSEMLRSGVVKPEDTPHFVDNIYQEAKRLIALVNDIIKLSQLDENDLPAELEKLELLEAARDVADQLKSEADGKGISLMVGGEKAYISGASRIISEMLYNLCDNAIKYNRDGGSVFVTVTAHDGKAAVEVRDTGIGIPPEHQERIFERFYRVDKSHSKRGGGTGLGLSIVKHGAAFHKAEIRLESELGKGTAITVTFPEYK